MGGSCGTYSVEEKYVQGVNKEPGRKEDTWKTLT
jgi:hypothetical protein